MRKLLMLLFLSVNFLSFSQFSKSINSYKYIVIKESNINSMRKTVIRTLTKSGYRVVNDTYPSDLINNPTIGLYLNIDVRCSIVCKAQLDFYDYNNNLVYSCNGSNRSPMNISVENALKTLKSFNYKYVPQEDNTFNNLKLPSSFDEVVVRDFLDTKKDLEPLEGLYRYVPKDSRNSSQYKFLILKEDFTYFGLLAEANCVGCENWRIGNVKFKMVEGAVKEILDVTWKYPPQERKRDGKIIMTSKVGGNLLDSNTFSLIKLYPKANSKRKLSKNGEWAGNGSGVIISKSGHIITNHHVIEDAEKIEVEFMLNDELQKFNAEVVQVDKINDLAVLKIFDMNFDGVSEPPYNFKFRGSDVGTKVYAFGYPMALTVMGKEIKVTDGMISSKTGFDGNITTYQITAPIQGGNSGGPLFDEQANLIGINSSGIRKDIADNVAYSIKTSYVSNLLDVLPKSIELPSSTRLKSLPLTEQIKEISKYVVLVKVK